jgi:hypothetical protein
MVAMRPFDRIEGGEKIDAGVGRKRREGGGQRFGCPGEGVSFEKAPWCQADKAPAPIARIALYPNKAEPLQFGNQPNDERVAEAKKRGDFGYGKLLSFN